MGPTSLWRLAAMRQLVGLSVLGFIGFCLTLASLPYWAASGGASAATAGVPTGVLLACTVLTQTAVPALVARLGMTRVLASGLVALGAPAPFYLLSQDLRWLMALSVVRGYGFAVLTVVGAAITARIAPAGRRGESIGVYALASAVPNLLAVPAGVALALAGRFDWVALLAAAPLLGLPLVRGLDLAEGEEQEDELVAAPTGSRLVLLAAGLPSAVLLVVTLAGNGLVTFLPIERPNGSLVPLALLAFGLTGAIGRWRAGAWADRIGTRLLLPAALCLAAVGLAAVAVGLLMPSGGGAAVWVLAGAAVFGAGYGAVQNLTLVVTFARAGRAGATTASAIWNASFDAGLAIGALLVGVVAAAGLGLPRTYVGCAVLIAGMLPLAIMLTSGRQTHRS